MSFESSRRFAVLPANQHQKKLDAHARASTLIVLASTVIRKMIEKWTPSRCDPLPERISLSSERRVREILELNQSAVPVLRIRSTLV